MDENVPPLLPPVPPPDLPPVPVSSDDKIWMIGSHLSLLLGVGFLLPLIVYLAKREDSPLVAAHAKEALNFHLSLLLCVVLTVPLICIGLPLFLLIAVGSVILAIVAAVEASTGRFYHYPLTIRFIR